MRTLIKKKYQNINPKGKQEISVPIQTRHRYLEDDSVFQTIIREVMEDYIEERQDQILRKELHSSQKIQSLNALFLTTVGNV